MVSLSIHDADAAPISTPWGPAGAVVLCLLPIAFLIVVTMVKAVMLPSRVSLPLSAALMGLVRLAYLAADPALVFSSLVAGCLAALIPLSVVYGAILLFQIMTHTKCLPWMMLHVKRLSAGNPVAEVFLIGWSFAYLIEGMGGFGAPLALAAPMLVSLGHDPLASMVVMIVFNSICSHISSVGLVVWFGFDSLGLGDANILLIGTKAAVIVGVPTFIVVPAAATFIVPWREIRRSCVFVFLSILTAVVPTFGVAFVSKDFPCIIGGLVSTVCTGLLVYFKIGLLPPLADTTGSMARAKTLDQLAVTEAAAAAAAAAGLAITTPRPASEKGSNSCDVDVLASPAKDAVAIAIASSASRSLVMSHSMVCKDRDKSGLRIFSSRVTGREGDDDVEAQLSAEHAAQSSPVVLSSSGSRDWADVARLADSRHAQMRRFGSLGAAGMLTSSVSLVAVRPAADAATRSQAATPFAAYAPGSLTCVVATAPAAQPKSPRVVKQAASAELSRLKVAEVPPMTLKDALLRTMPMWLTLLVLMATRIPQLQIKALVTRTTPAFHWQLGTLGLFSTSASLVVQLQAILTNPEANWKYELFYVPCLLPFVFASLVTLAVHWRDRIQGESWRLPFNNTWAKVASTAAAMMGALALAELMREGGTASPAFILGYYLSAWLGKGFIAVAGLLGALSTFVSGSVMGGNIMMGSIQKVAAIRLGVPITSMLALQDAGCCAGKMVCVSNLLAATAIMNLPVSERVLIKKTALSALLLLVLSTAVNLIFMFPINNGKFLWPDFPIPSVSAQ